ncbi:hypothetical protein BC332_20505 [Capsicum chinense]|nr:hypothetical protein BC332_20505 [Capsicum chinense]
MFIGGTDTSAILMVWTLSELMKNPAVMKKVQSEVRETLKGKKIADHSNVQKLKYLKLIVKETLRLHPPGSLALSRESTEQIVINGYIIPNKTIVLRIIKCSYGVLGIWIWKKKLSRNVICYTSSEHRLAKLLYHFDWKI